MAEPDKLIMEVSPMYKKKKKPSQTFNISYNSSMESLEPVYFWLLDFIQPFGDVEKINDTFQSTVGSGHFSELMGKATRMQEEGMKIMQTIGVLIKSVINIVYDLKQFELRLNDYKAIESEDPNKKEAGQLALKQVWLDNVDIKRGNSSIKAMTFSQQGAFVMLLNAFMAAKSLKNIDEMDLNDIVKRVLKQRYLEFEEWVKLSKSELTKRYNIQKHWLKSQVDSIKLYSRWAQPYFKAAEALRQDDKNSPNLIKTFNSIVLNLSLLITKPVDVAKSVVSKDLPNGFEKLNEKKQIRKTYACEILDFTFRGIPQKVDQHYGFGGKSDVSFKAFALNQDELDLFKAKLEESDVNEALKMVKVVTEESLTEIQDDINYFLKDLEERKEEDKKQEKNKENVNPFSSLFNFSNFFPKKEEKKDKKDEEKKKKEKLEKLKKEGVKPDNYAEKMVRAIAEESARKTCFTVYDVYKKAHGMASVPFGDTLIKRKVIDVSFGEIFQK